MLIDVGGVDGAGLNAPACLGQRRQHRLSEAASGPTVDGVVDHGGRAIVGRADASAAAHLHDVGDPGDHLPVIIASGAGLVDRHGVSIAAH